MTNYLHEALFAPHAASDAPFLELDDGAVLSFRDFDGLAARMAHRASRLAAARAASRLRARRRDGGQWRQAGLLWPLFTKEGR